MSGVHLSPKARGSCADRRHRPWPSGPSGRLKTSRASADWRSGLRVAGELALRTFSSPLTSSHGAWATWEATSRRRSISLISASPVTEAIDTGAPIGRAMLGILAVFAQLEAEHASERVRNGLKAARSRGKRLG
ncbi:recombinase family protein [Phenylobacterium sp.]|uniref:recombinase family protein n=1 Tax=Phenylobacterium sp. TaxID=1871053 RepID=UPI003566FA2D